MDHRGIDDRTKPRNIASINEFLECAFGGKEYGAEVRCPSVNYNLCLLHNQSSVLNHLIVRSILRNYNPWTHHGECENRLCEATNGINFGNQSIEDRTENESGQNEVPKEFHKLMEDVKAELYPNCKTFARLEFIVIQQQQHHHLPLWVPLTRGLGRSICRQPYLYRYSYQWRG